MQNNLYQQQIDLCNIALESIQLLISIEKCQDISNYINQFGEWGLGLEILIDHICEFEIRISPKQFEQFRLAMVSMRWDECKRLQDLHEYVE